MDTIIYKIIENKFKALNIVKHLIAEVPVYMLYFIETQNLTKIPSLTNIF